MSGGMRTLLAASLLAALAFTSAGCPGLGCSGYQGASDRVYARGNDELILCANGGYSATIGAATFEGYYTDNPAGSAVAVVGTDGPTGAHSFDLANQPDGTANVAPYGDGWQKLALDQTALDHADANCRAVETRAWWTGK